MSEIVDPERDKILQELGFDPIAVLSSEKWHGSSDHGPSFTEVLRGIGRLGAHHLSPLLRSLNPTISARALHIFSELGRAGKPIIGDAIIGLKHAWATARWDTIEGLMYHRGDMSPSQLAQVLNCASDPDPRVRRRVGEAIAGTSFAALENSVNKVASDRRSHITGLELLRKPLNQEAAFDTLKNDDAVQACYAFGSLLQAADEIANLDVRVAQLGTEDAVYFAQKMVLRRARLASRRNSKG